MKNRAEAKNIRLSSILQSDEPPVPIFLMSNVSLLMSLEIIVMNNKTFVHWQQVFISTSQLSGQQDKGASLQINETVHYS